MFCTNCGRHLDEKQNYCDGCGAKVKNNSNNEQSVNKDDEITFYNNSSNIYNMNNNHRQANPNPYDPNEGKVLGIICGLFVPFIIAIFLGLIYSNSKSTSNYYKYFWLTILIKFGVIFLVVIILIIIMSSIQPIEMIFKF